MTDLPEVAADFIVDRKAAGLSPNTIRWYTDWSKRFIAFLRQRGLPLDANKVTAQHVRDFLADLRERRPWEGVRQVPRSRKISRATVNCAFRALRALFNWAAEEGRIATNPMHRLKEPKMPQKTPAVFTKDEIERLLNTAATWGQLKERNSLVVQLLLDTGIRLSELTGLTLHNVFPNEGYIKVKGKGSKERLVPIGTVVQRSLSHYVERVRPKVKTNALFLTKDGRRLKNSGVRSLLRRMGKAAGVTTRVHPHKFRHTFAKEYLMHGGNLESLRRILGHTSLEMARRYLGLLIDDLEALHRKASPMDNWEKEMKKKQLY